MATIWTYLRATAIVVGSSAALLTGGIAHADTAPAPAPALNIPQQLISSAANAPQILQNLATALGATPPVTPSAPGISFPGLTPAAATVPTSSAATLPSLPGIMTPAAASAPTIPRLPASTPGVPQARVDMPAMPFLPVSIPPQISLPGDLQALASSASAAAAPIAAPTLLSALP
ncbi:hypothetical protein [Mycobacterium lepromatosis]|uniref:Exported repetitive protein n=1 Tax=Mycobacterium lepromatosis TaxID=480418 RepID=A0A0F4EQ85_9MYCO|nr:hypothetical protein [Mycobacterium lepromatosis]KJX75096.1 hypothetical protein MLPM_1505 [Mycobacterium lepromatosis]